MSTPIFSLFPAALQPGFQMFNQEKGEERELLREQNGKTAHVHTYVVAITGEFFLSSLLFHYSSLFLWQKTTLPKVHPYSGEHLKTHPSYLTSYYMQPTTFIHFLMQSLCSNCAIEVFTPVVTSNMSRVLFLFRLFSRERERMRLWCWHELPQQSKVQKRGKTTSHFQKTERRKESLER